MDSGIKTSLNMAVQVKSSIESVLAHFALSCVHFQNARKSTTHQMARLIVTQSATQKAPLVICNAILDTSPSSCPKQRAFSTRNFQTMLGTLT